MVPSTVTVHGSLPLTVNGKVDPARLPAPFPGPAGIRAETPDGASPVSSVRATLRRVWTEMLGTEVGDQDDFFELGGNLLLALRMSAGLREAGLTPAPLRDLYRHPRIADLVAMTTNPDDGERSRPMTGPAGGDGADVDR